MIPLPEFKKLLGEEAKDFPDEKVEHIRNISYQLADAIIEYWLRKKNVGKNDLIQPD